MIGKYAKFGRTYFGKKLFSSNKAPLFLVKGKFRRSSLNKVRAWAMRAKSRVRARGYRNNRFNRVSRMRAGGSYF